MSIAYNEYKYSMTCTTVHVELGMVEARAYSNLYNYLAVAKQKCRCPVPLKDRYLSVVDLACRYKMM